MPVPSDPPQKADVLVIGAGVVGLAFALAAARAGARTLCVDLAAIPPSAAEDPRTAALYPPAAKFLQGLGVWPAAQPLRDIRVVDEGSGRGRAASIRLGGKDIGSEHLAWNVANSDLHAALADTAERQPDLEVLRPRRVVQMLRREDAALAILDDGRRVRTQLVAAADGAESASREMAGIPALRWNHGKTALAFLAKAERDTQRSCIEIHASGQALTLVPATEGRMAAIWTLPQEKARTMLGKPPEAVAEDASRLTASHVGRLKMLTGPRPWPVRSLCARQLTARRLALLGEAAHVLPPAGAQGLNLSLGDASALAELICKALNRGDDLGDNRLLAAYARRRLPEIALRGMFTEGFARALTPVQAPIAPLRRASIRAIAGSPRLRRGIARCITGALG